MGLRKLSDREVAVVKLKCKGMQDKEIARTLSISYWTVRSYLSRAKTKLKCASTIQVVAKCK